MDADRRDLTATAGALAARPAIRWLLRRRVWVVAAIAGGQGAFDSLAAVRASDFWTFGEAGRQLLSGRWADVFADPWIQVGPLQLLFSALVRGVAAASPLSERLVFSVAVYVALALGCMGAVAAAYRAAGRDRSAAAELIAGSVAAVGGLGWTAFVSGHPVEGLIPLLWMAAIVAVRRRDRRGVGGALVGVAAGLKLWGILGLPLLVIAPSFRRRLEEGGAAVAASALLYGPFLLYGEVNTFSNVWRVEEGSVLSVLVSPGTPFTWPMRVVQGAVIVGGGVAVAWRLRSSAAALWAAPLAIVGLRLLVDPLAYHYYWLAVDVLTLVGILQLAPRLRPTLVVALVAFFYVTLLSIYVPFGAWIVGRLAFVAVLVWLGMRAEPRPAAFLASDVAPGARPDVGSL